MDPEPTRLFITILQFNYWTEIIGLIAALLVLLLLSAIVSGAEVAFFSLNKKDLEEAKEEGIQGLGLIEKLLKSPKKLLATLLITLNLFNIGIVIVVSALMGHFLIQSVSFFGFTIEKEWVEFIIELLLDLFLILIFAEIIPKIYANNQPLRFALSVKSLVNIYQDIFSPFSSILLKLSKSIEKHLGESKESISVDKLSQALELTSESIEEQDIEDQKILEGIVNFGNTDAKQVMTPRVDMFALSMNTSYDNVLKTIAENGYSRIPIFKENIDDIEGILYAKDLIKHISQENFEWQKVIRKPFFIPENKKLDDLLNDFKERKVHLAIVVDEYGGTSGIVPMDDISEEIVGDISDEVDIEEENYTKIDDKTYVFEGKTSLKDFYRVMKIEDEEKFEEVKGESDTLAGFIIEVNEEFPKQRQVIEFKNYKFTVEALDKKRVKQIRVTETEKPTSED
mgnify:FL=1